MSIISSVNRHVHSLELKLKSSDRLTSFTKSGTSKFNARVDSSSSSRKKTSTATQRISCDLRLMRFLHSKKGRLSQLDKSTNTTTLNKGDETNALKSCNGAGIMLVLQPQHDRGVLLQFWHPNGEKNSLALLEKLLTFKSKTRFIYENNRWRQHSFIFWCSLTSWEDEFQIPDTVYYVWENVLRSLPCSFPSIKKKVVQYVPIDILYAEYWRVAIRSAALISVGTWRFEIREWYSAFSGAPSFFGSGFLRKQYLM